MQLRQRRAPRSFWGTHFLSKIWLAIVRSLAGIPLSPTAFENPLPRPSSSTRMKVFSDLERIYVHAVYSPRVSHNHGRSLCLWINHKLC